MNGIKETLSKLRHDGHITEAEYKELIRMCGRDQELIKRFRELQHGHRVDGGYHRGVSACLRELLNEMEGGTEDGEGCC